MDKKQRPVAHEIDTRAIRRIAGLFPNAWVDRLVSNDYGIDLELEPFSDGRSLGNLLFLQVKGTSRTDLKPDQPWTFSMKVSGLRYAELFSVPVLLILAPVEQSGVEPRFIWLQRYIDVVLDFDKPEWRNQVTCTLRLPPENVFLSSEADEIRLMHIANEPRRAKQFGRLAYFAHEYTYAQSRYSANEDRDDLIRMSHLIDDALKLDALFGPSGWAWSNFMADQNVRVPHEIMGKLLRRETVELSDFRTWRPHESVSHVDEELLVNHLIEFSFGEVGNALLSVAAHPNNIRLERANWELCGDHEF